MFTNIPPIYSSQSAGDVADSESCGIGESTSISVGTIIKQWT